VLRFLREQAGLSIRKAAAIAGIGDGVIAHLEQGRIDISDRHLERLLPAYKSTRDTYEMFVAGRVQLPENLRFECIEILKSMTAEQIRTAHPVLASLFNRI
jgi:transcriptional regulator with XRE-family HTH domain